MNELKFSKRWHNEERSRGFCNRFRADGGEFQKQTKTHKGVFAADSIFKQKASEQSKSGELNEW